MTPEILAPAGSFESLVAAVRSGADAVYLGAQSFNARQHAAGFTPEELRKAADYCRLYGVRLYLTLNTLIREDELPAAVDVARLAASVRADALILQDVGLASVLRQVMPRMPLHASTQLSCHSPAGVRQLYELGFSRVVLAREMSIEEIAACAGLGPELEVFVHGALCMSVSGQCYLSAVLGRRSGNRGLCAQPCRLPFEPYAPGAKAAATGHALSLKDLSAIDYIQQLKTIGVAALKIEGRMKRPEYVAAATSVYKAAVRGETDLSERMADLQAVFSRSGFTSGYLAGRRGREMFGIRRKEDVVAAAPVLGRLQALYDKEQPRVGVTARLTLRQDAPATLTVTDQDGHNATVTGEPPQPAVHRPLDRERAAQQLSKTGGTPFFMQDISLDIDHGVTFPISSLNALRRQALDQLSEQRMAFTPIETCPIPPAAPIPPVPSPFGKTNKPALVARVAHAGQLTPALVQSVDAVILPLSQSAAGAALPIPWGVEIPRGLFGIEQPVTAQLKTAVGQGAAFALCNNIGAIPLAISAGLKPVGGFGLNITNRQALATYAELGLTAATLSFELAFSQMKFALASAKDGIATGLFAYGRLPLMLTRNCPRACALPKGCDSCAKEPFTDSQAGGLIDRKGMVFPTACNGGTTELLNAVPLYWADKLDRLPPLDFYLLHFTTEGPRQAAELAAAYRVGGPPKNDITRGLYDKGIL